MARLLWGSMLVEMRALLLVDHGSRRAEANEVLLVVRGMLEAALGTSILVGHAHMELAPPSIEEAVHDLLARGASELFVQPWFLVPGRHAESDVPRLVEEALVGRTLPAGWALSLGQPMGADELLVRLALERFRAGSI